MLKSKTNTEIKTNWEDVIKESVKDNPKLKSQNLNMNDSYHINELTNSVVKIFPSLYNKISISILRVDGKAIEVRYKFLIDMGEDKQEATNTIVAKAYEIGIPTVTELK